MGHRPLAYVHGLMAACMPMPPPCTLHCTGYNPYVVGARIREIVEEEKQLRLEISPIYSEIILKHSSYRNPQQDR